MAARHLDQRRVGQRLFMDPAHRSIAESSLIERFGANRDWFYTGRTGSGNGGHDFWSRIRTDSNRFALIEYLKTL
jgi:hypothetical protein